MGDGSHWVTSDVGEVCDCGQGKHNHVAGLYLILNLSVEKVCLLSS